MEQQLRGTYTQQGLVHALNIYNFPESYPRFLYLKALRYLFIHLRKTNRITRLCPKKTDLINKSREMFNIYHQKNDEESMAEIADILNTYTGITDLLDRLQEPEIVYVPNQPILKSAKTVYEDKQNVHTLNSSVIYVLENLCAKYKEISSFPETMINDCIENIRTELITKHRDQRYIINSGIDYIKTNIATFGKQQITMANALLALWLFIIEHKDREELEKRIIEELKEMHGLCTTGHVARLMNVIQGFTDDEKLFIRISNQEQCNAVIKTYLNKRLSNCNDDEVLEGMLDGREKYKEFLRKCVAEIILEWQQTYGKDMLDNIAKLVNIFAQTEVFTV